MIIPQLNIENEGLEPVIMPLKKDKKKYLNADEPVKDKRIILHKKKKKHDSFLFAAIIFVTILLLCALFLKDKFSDIYKNIFVNNDVVETQFITSLPDETFAEKIIPDETLPDESIPNEVIIEKETKPNSLISLSTYKELYLPYQKGNYYLIAGSFTKEESALLHIKQKKLDKFHAKLIVHPDSPRIRVCIGVFDNEEEATKIALQLDKNYWVLK